MRPWELQSVIHGGSDNLFGMDVWTSGTLLGLSLTDWGVYSRLELREGTHLGPLVSLGFQLTDTCPRPPRQAGQGKLYQP